MSTTITVPVQATILTESEVSDIADLLLPELEHSELEVPLPATGCDGDYFIWFNQDGFDVYRRNAEAWTLHAHITNDQPRKETQ